jgi:hypothetical protein
VIEEFDIAKTHYAKLNIADRMQIEIHEGGHEAMVESGVKFMNRWLKPDTNQK